MAHYYLSISGTYIINIDYEANPHQSIRELIADIVWQFDMNSKKSHTFYLCAHIGNKNIRLEEEKVLADYNLQPGTHLRLVVVKENTTNHTLTNTQTISHNAIGRNPDDAQPFNCLTSEQAPKHSIPKKTPFFKRVHRRISEIFSQREYVNSTVFAPSVAERGETMTIQLLLYKDSQYANAIKKAKQVDPEAEERISQVIGVPLKKGDIISANLTFFPRIQEDYVKIEENIKQVIWDSKTKDIVFSVYIDERFSKKLLNGKVVIKVNDIPVSEAIFRIKIVSYKEMQTTLADIEMTRLGKIFISYSHLDTDKVQYISETCKAMKCDYFFDRHDLDPGDRFEEKIFKYIDNANLFILCWSENAASSDWVKKEIKRALENLKKDDQSLHLYPISIPPKTELPDNMKGIFNFGELM